MRIRTAGKGIVGAAAMVVTGWASVAFACSPMPRVYSVTPESAAPGSTVMVEGREIGSTSPVEIRWNGVKGPVIGTAVAEDGVHGTEFATEVTIPQSGPGVYYLMLVAADSGIGRAAFEVTAPSTATSPASTPAVAKDAWGTLDAPLQSGAGTSGSSGALRNGLALLGFGSAALLAGGALAASGRRRVRAEHLRR